MKKLIKRFKYLIYSDILEVDLPFFDLFILFLSAIWGIILFIILPVRLISFLFYSFFN